MLLVLDTLVVRHAQVVLLHSVGSQRFAFSVLSNLLRFVVRVRVLPREAYLQETFYVRVIGLNRPFTKCFAIWVLKNQFYIPETNDGNETEFDRAPSLSRVNGG